MESPDPVIRCPDGVLQSIGDSGLRFPEFRFRNRQGSRQYTLDGKNYLRKRRISPVTDTSQNLPDPLFDSGVLPGSPPDQCGPFGSFRLYIDIHHISQLPYPHSKSGFLRRRSP